MAPSGIERNPPTLASSLGSPKLADYRAFLRADAADQLIEVVVDQFSTWLRKRKNLDLVLSPSGAGVSGPRAADVMHHRNGGVDLVRCRLAEHGPKTNGRWDTEVMASSAGWLSISVVPERASIHTRVPGIAKALMQATPLRDGALLVEDRVRRWRSRDLDSLVAIMEDPRRRGPLLVAGTSASDLEYPFAVRLADWAQDVYGLAQAIVLDPDATEAANERLGAYGPKPWTIRTLLPGLVLEDWEGSRRHRFMGTARLATDDDRAIRTTLANAIRRHSSDGPVPKELIDARRMFARLDAAPGLVLPRESASLVAPPSAVSFSTTTGSRDVSAVEASDKSAHTEDVTDLVAALVEVERQALSSEMHELLQRHRQDDRRAVDDLLGQIEGLEDELAEVRRLQQDSELELALVEEERDFALRSTQKLENRIKFLEDAAREAQRFDLLAGEPALPERPLPTSCVDAITRLDEFEYLVFTGKIKDVDEVDQRDNVGRAAAETWAILLALDGYGAATASDPTIGSFKRYLELAPAGYPKLSPKKHVPSESNATMQQFGEDRRFPVPVEVDPSCSVLMSAHFRLPKSGIATPRLHYYDDLSNTGKLYIGYLGAHLRNTQTN